MATTSKAAFNPTRAWELAGLAFLWPCLQSSGFYPLSVVPSIASMDAATVAFFHLCYSIELIVAFAVMIALRRRLEALFRSSRTIPVLGGFLGAVGHALLIACEAGSSSSRILIMAGMPLVATFEAAFVLLWGCRLSSDGGGRAVLGIAISFAASQLGLIVVCGGFLPYAPFLLVCAVCTGMCAAFSARGASLSRTFDLSSMRQLPWRMAALMMLLVYFCVVYVRLRIPEFSGDASMSSKLFASVLCLCTFSAVVLCLRRFADPESGLVVVFIILASVYMVGLLMVALFPDDGSVLARRVLIAGEHCVEVFIWMTFAYAAARKRLSAVLAFGILGILVVALPWMLSFDFRYLVPIAESVVSSDALNSVVTVALCVTALGTIAYLSVYALQIARKASEDAHSSHNEAAKRAFANVGLTERELEVGVLVYRGYSAKRIAEMLYVSEPTVKSYTSRVYRKIGVHSKQELIGFVDGRDLFM